MTEKLKQTIKENLVNLPKELQDAINTLDWETISEEIGKKYLSNESKINDLQVETSLIIVGLTYGDSYVLNIENNVGTTKDEAEKIAEEVNQKIFMPIYYSLTENIKNNLKNKKPNWKQTLNFIISGGDYSVFMEKNDSTNINTEIPKITTLDNSKKIEAIKSKFTI